MPPNTGTKRKLPEQPNDNVQRNTKAQRTEHGAIGTGGGGGANKYIVTKAMPDEPEIEQPEGAGIIPKVPFRWIMSGPSKSGKTNLARYALDNLYCKPDGRPFFDEIHLLSPTATIDYNWSKLKGLKDEHRHDQPTADTLNKILNDAKREIAGTTSDRVPTMPQKTLFKKKEKAKKRLIIIDDSIAEGPLINSKPFLKTFIQGRHYNVSSMIMSQSYMNIPRASRLQASHVSMFPSKTTEIERLHKEHGTRHLSKKEFMELAEQATEPAEGDEFPFLYVDVFAPVHQKYRRNFTTCMEINTTQNVPIDEQGGTDKLSKEEEKEVGLDEAGGADDPANTEKKQRKRKRKTGKATETKGPGPMTKKSK